MGRELPAYQPTAAAAQTGAETLAFEEPTGPLELSQALALALQRNPELAAFSWDVRAAEARELQARLWPNPEAGVEVENAGGNLSGFRESETTVSLAQNILFAPKRSRTMQVAAAETKLAGWQYEAKRLAVFTDVVQAFVAVLGAQDRVKLAEETARIAQEVLTAATRRVEVGEAPAVEQTRAAVVHARVLTELERARQELQNARVRLASLWGSAMPRFREARGELEAELALPALEELRQRLRQNPELMAAAAEVAKRRAALALERARRIPDVTAQAGYRRLEGEAANTFVFGVSAPLPLLDRNQGLIREARANLAKARWQQTDAEVRALAALTQAYGELATTLKERQAFREKILPGAIEAFEKTRAGYAQGTFDYLELLTAQETLAKTRADYVEVLVRLNQAVANLERLIGEPLRTQAPPHDQPKHTK